MLEIKSWAEDVEAQALEQAEHLAKLPFAFHHIALMPDCHSGYGMPIGGVLAAQDHVIPNAVGVDIGCGVISIRSTLHHDMVTPEKLKQVLGILRERIPTGFNHHKEPQSVEMLPEVRRNQVIVRREYQAAKYQLGTLGGGNHFIEIQFDEAGTIWFTLHSGSRNIGHKVASYYNDLAVEKGKYPLGVPKEWELACFHLDSEEGQAYLSEMRYCVDFAFENRYMMASVVKEALVESFAKEHVGFPEQVHIAHNYANLEEHFGQMVMIHRKGATSAEEGQMGVIPGSQGTSTYIVRGKGNPDSFKSCSHGAGRKMGRKQAQRSLNLEAEKKMLDEQGIIHTVRNTKDLDEAPSAYKDIVRVMARQKDLVEVVHTLRPLAVMKG